MQFSAPAFADGAPIPVEYTCDGANIAPALSWSAAPQDTASFALVVSDPDAPGGTFIHWLRYNLPAESTSLPSGLTAANAPAGAQQGKNGLR
jgi:Raf kinase inhibitor-like YbhB/YbcL family protein